MGPFSNNPTPVPQPRNGTKLPVPAVDAKQPPVELHPEPDHSEGFRKWLMVTLVLVGVTIVAAAGVVAANIYFSNTPQALVGAALQDAVQDGLAGEYVYTFGQQTLRGDFLTYPDPTNSHQQFASVSVGQGDSRVGAEALAIDNTAYVRMSGLASSRRLVESYHGNAAALTPDVLTQLGALDGAWFTAVGQPSPGDLEQLRQLYVSHPFLTVTQEYPDTTVGSTPTAHVRLGVDSRQLADFAQAVKAARIQGVTLEGMSLPGNFSAEVWISRSDRVFRQVKLSFDDKSLLVMFHPDTIAAQQQAIQQPDAAQPIQSLTHALQTAFSLKP